MAVTSHVLLNHLAVLAEADGKVINISGRQRMLSQKIAKDVAELDDVKHDPRAYARVLAELNAAHKLWRESHVQLQEGGGPDDLPVLEDEQIQAAFARLQPEFETIDTAVRLMQSDPESRSALLTILGHEAEFLRLQDEIVHMFEDANRAKSERLRLVMTGLTLATLLTLLLEGLLVFAPAVRAMKRQVADLEAAAEVMTHRARHDMLTGLANRAHLLNKLEDVLARPDHAAQPFVLMMIDFDRFKLINDTLGHEAGDEVLIEIARRMKTFDELTTGCTLSCFRLGGDEFVMLLQGEKAEQILPTFAEVSLEVFAEPHVLQGQSYVSTASIGAVSSSRGHRDAVSLVRDADIAMYQAKEAGKGRMVVFDRSMYEHAQRRRLVENDLIPALADRAIEVWYEPVRNAGSTQVEAVEAVVVWEHPELGTLGQNEIIDLAEQTGVIEDLTDLVLETVADDLSDPQRQRWSTDTHVHVNVGHREFLRPEFQHRIEAHVRRCECLAGRLCLELTDLALDRDHKSIRPVMLSLQRTGVSFAIDHREGGPIAFRQLAELPFDMVKLVMPRLTADSQDVSVSISLLEAVQSLAKGRGLMVVGTGVSTHDQVAAAAALGIDLLQGPLIGEPGPLGPTDEPRQRTAA